MKVMSSIIKATAVTTVATKKATKRTGEAVKAVPSHTGNLKGRMGAKFNAMKVEYGKAVEECNAPKPLKAPKPDATPININKKETSK